MLKKFPLSLEYLDKVITESNIWRGEPEVEKRLNALRWTHLSLKEAYRKYTPEECRIMKEDFPVCLLEFEFNHKKNIYIPKKEQDWGNIVVQTFYVALEVEREKTYIRKS